jgi:hypothetical protein
MLRAGTKTPPAVSRGLRTVALASFVVVVAACRSEPQPPPPIEPAGGCAPECVTAIPCRKNSCEGELFWNGCCPCPAGAVVAWSCLGDGGT